METVTGIAARLFLGLATLCLWLLCAMAAQAMDSAAFVSQSVPTSMVGGNTYAVSVTMQNNGTSLWSVVNNYRLGSRNPLDNTKWGLNRVQLPNSVAYGQNATFTFTVTAPTTSGTHSFQWGMMQDGVGHFGAASTNVGVSVTGNNAQLVSQSVPASMVVNQTYAVTVTMKNTGTTAWAVGTQYLASENAADNTRWGLNRVDLASPVAVNANATFSFNVTPTAGGVHNFQWRMAQAGARFGAYTTNVAVSVTGATNDAAFVSQDVPATMSPGQTYPVSVTLQNSGNTTWSPGTGFHLGSHNPQDNTTWGTSRAGLAAAVAPGGNATLNFNAIAPAANGTYNFQWRMLQDNVGWFGATTPNSQITVGSLDSAVHFIHVDHLNTPRAIYNDQQQLAWRWDQQEPFGNSPPDENPSGLGTFECNLRFPGQYFDKETSLAYNYFRDFDPGLGRYVQSDPIGLRGGLNTYGYVGGNPLWSFDSLGLAGLGFVGPVIVTAGQVARATGGGPASFAWTQFFGAPTTPEGAAGAAVLNVFGAATAWEVATAVAWAGGSTLMAGGVLALATFTVGYQLTQFTSNFIFIQTGCTLSDYAFGYCIRPAANPGASAGACRN